MPSSRPPFDVLRHQHLWVGSIIDVDAHAVVPSLDALRPYLDDVWADFLSRRGWKEPVGLELVYPREAPGSCRPEWRPKNGQVPASTVDLLRAHVLDALDVDRALVTCYYSLESLRHPDAASAVAAAVNDWLISEWLERDPRLAASIVVPGHDAGAVAREIERVGAHPGFVQVLMPVRSTRLYGDRQWNASYAAMTRHDLVMGLHMGGRTHLPPSATGWPSWFIEEYASEVQNFIAQITSLIAEGTFQAFRDLRVTVLEAGFAWLPAWTWRLDKDWKGVRREIPWVEKPPTEIIREHFRFSTAPLEIKRAEQLVDVLTWLDSDETLMFATDYPHHHDDDLRVLIDALEPPARAKVMAENARDWYRL